MSFFAIRARMLFALQHRNAATRLISPQDLGLPLAHKEHWQSRQMQGAIALLRRFQGEPY
jgi:hypothetical protein